MAAEYEFDPVQSFLTSNLSLIPFQIWMEDSEGFISHGTAFFAEYNGGIYIVTAGHNFTGKNAFTGDYLPSKRRPVSIRLVLFLSTIGEGGGQMGPCTSSSIALYNENLSEPSWYSSNSYGDVLDIAVLPVEEKSIPKNCYNIQIKLDPPIERLGIGSQIFVTGFPDRISNMMNLPTWKFGFVSTEPRLPIRLSNFVETRDADPVLPAFLIDMMGRKGMSGAPIFHEYTGPLNARPIELQPTLNMPTDYAGPESRMTSLVGIYTGRVPTQTGEATFGIGWPIAEILRICKDKEIAKHPHI